MGLLDTFIYIILIILLISIGWIGNDLYKDYQLKNELKPVLNGMWFGNWPNETKVMNELYSIDYSGEWICINVRKEMNSQDIIDTCTHEASHELFARKCQDNPKICFEVENATN